MARLTASRRRLRFLFCPNVWAQNTAAFGLPLNEKSDIFSRVRYMMAFQGRCLHANTQRVPQIVFATENTEATEKRVKNDRRPPIHHTLSALCPLWQIHCMIRSSERYCHV